MRFSVDNPTSNLKLTRNIIDSHLHVWGVKHYKKYLECANKYNIKKVMAIAQPDIREELLKTNLANNIIFGFYLSVKAFGTYNQKKLIKEIDTAYQKDYKVLKMWFAPRFQDYAKVKGKFDLLSSKLEPVFSRIEDYEMIMLIHVSDPDVTYLKQYSKDARYGDKQTRNKEFSEMLDRYQKLRIISAHFGCLPENLDYLGKMLDKYPLLNVDTASTRWMIRELGKNPQTKNWFKKYSNRILFGSDLSLQGNNFKFEYLASRYWSQRVFYETNIKTDLPFKDDDNPKGTKINGLDLSEKVLNRIYYDNAQKLFEITN
jgi:predicted TIM-barrel fold metal-dependent hydrolase